MMNHINYGGLPLPLPPRMCVHLPTSAKDQLCVTYPQVCTSPPHTNARGSLTAHHIYIHYVCQEGVCANGKFVLFRFLVDIYVDDHGGGLVRECYKRWRSVGYRIPPPLLPTYSLAE